MEYSRRQKILDPILNILFPRRCLHCGSSFTDGLSNVVCRGCFDSIPSYENPVCDHCGVSLPPGAFEGAVERRCGDCGKEAYFLDHVRSFGPYGGALRLAHHAFKFDGMERLRADLAPPMAALEGDAFWSDAKVLVPVPQSPERERERGYNPASLLAGEIAEITSCPCRPLLRKVRATEPQMSLKREARMKNPKGAYQVAGAGAVPDKIVLVDDVFTTGSTLEECARVLKKAGAHWVGALVFGRTPRY